MNDQSTSDVRMTVDRMDADRKATIFRDPDRADACFLRRRDPQPLKVAKAMARVRTDRWRTGMDRRHAPTASQIGMSLVTALATARFGDLTDVDRGLVGAMLTDLQARGFDVKEALATLRRLRTRLIDRAERASGATRSDRPDNSGFIT